MTTHKRGVDARCNIHFVDSLSLPLSLSLSLLASVYFLVLVLVHVHVHVHVLVLVHVSVDDQTPLCAFAEMKYIYGPGCLSARAIKHPSSTHTCYCGGNGSPEPSKP